MKTKGLSLRAFLIIGIGFTAFGQPQVMQLDDGTKLTLLGVTTGTRQMAPGYENLATANWLYTPDRPSVVWILVEHEQGKWPSYELLISDKAKTGCVNLEKSTGSHVRDGVDIQGFLMRAFPRWDKEMLVRVKPSWDQKYYSADISKGEFVITNLAPAAAANWTPEPLPVTRSDGDLEVTLTKLVAGAPLPFRQGEHPLTNEPANQCVHLNFDFRQNGQPTTNWEPWPVSTSDATGNRVRGRIGSYPSNGINPIYPDRIHPSFPPVSDGYYYHPGLWLEQSPWKVRLEFIQRAGFSDDEMVTFTNLPVRSGTQQDADDEWTWDASKTNFNFVAEGTANGVHLQLLPPLLVVNRWQSSEKDISIIIEADSGFKPQGMNLTVVAATDEQGRELWSFEKPPWAGHYSIAFARVHDDVKSLNLKLALHKSRFVEFTVTPTKQ